MICLNHSRVVVGVNNRVAVDPWFLYKLVAEALGDAAIIVLAYRLRCQTGRQSRFNGLTNQAGFSLPAC